jgi:hypothetical protein
LRTAVFVVVGPCNDFGAAAVTNAVDAGGIVLEVVDRPALRTRTPQGDAAHDCFVWDEQLENRKVAFSIPDESIELSRPAPACGEARRE